MIPTNPSALAAEFMEQGYSASCPIIDMHGHWGPFAGGWLPAHPEERLADYLRRRGVARLVSSSHDALWVDPEEGNAELQAGLDRFPDLLFGYWAINPNFPELAERGPRDYENSRGFVGFKLLPDYHTYPVTGAAYTPVWEYAEAQELLVMVHTWGESGFDSPRLIEQVAERYPRARILMGHSGYGEWDRAIGVARDFEHVYLELTAVYAAHEWAMQPTGSGAPVPFLPYLHVNGIIEYMVAGAGSDKILFGTDMPWYSAHYAAGAILFAHIEDEERHNILHRNAEKLLQK